MGLTIVDIRLASVDDLLAIVVIKCRKPMIAIRNSGKGSLWIILGISLGSKSWIWPVDKIRNTASAALFNLGSFAVSAAIFNSNVL